MNDQEKYCLSPEDISLKRNNETRLLIKSIKELERYFYFIRKRNGSKVRLCNKYLKILN